MIRCDYYWKLLKQLFFTWLISCFILLGNFSDSERVARQNWFYWYSTLDTSIDLNVANKWQLMSQRFGNTQRMLAFSSSSWSRIYFWWSFNQKPYYFINYAWHRLQWYLKTYRLCDEIYFSWWFAELSNCADHAITDNFSVEVGGLFQSMTIEDYWAYNIYVWNCYWTRQLINSVCFSSSQYNKSICFWAGAWNQSSCVCSDCNNLTWSLGFDYDRDFTSINAAYLNNPPWFTPTSSWNDLVWSDNVSINNNISWDYIYWTCTYWQIIQELEKNWFSSYMCYWWLDNFDDWDSSLSYNPIPWTWKTLSQILAYSSVWDTPQEWFDFWNWLYWDDKFNSMWESYPAVYHTRFGFYYKYWNNKYFDSIREYCIVKADLNIDMDTTYKWKNSTFVWACDTYYDELRYWYNLNWTWSSWWVILWGNLDWIWSFSWVKVQNNPVVFMQDFFDKAKATISTDFSQSVLWYLPTYITGFLLALILFRFLMR